MRKGSRQTEEAKARISATIRGRTMDPNWVRKRTATRRKNNPVWHSEETIEKLRAASTGVIPSIETKQKISVSMRGIGLEARAKKAWSRRGYKHTEESREKIRYGMKRYWEEKRVADIKVEQEITDNLSEIRDAARHKKERRKIEGGD